MDHAEHLPAKTPGLDSPNISCSLRLGKFCQHLEIIWACAHTPATQSNLFLVRLLLIFAFIRGTVDIVVFIHSQLAVA